MRLSVPKLGPDKDHSDSLPGFLRSVTLPDSDRQRIYSIAWLPYLTGMDLAGEVLPNSLKTEIVVKANIREWRHIFALRCTRKAHPQIRALMLALLSALKEQLPVVFDGIGE